MMLHEAIRLGSMDTAQAFGALYRRVPRGYFGGRHDDMIRLTGPAPEDDDGVAVCALGAAAWACGYLSVIDQHCNYTLDRLAMDARWPVLRTVVRGEGQRSTLANLIMQWNDTKRLTREEIADKVEVIEREWLAKQAAPLVALPPPEPVAV